MKVGLEIFLVSLRNFLRGFLVILKAELREFRVI